MKNETKIIFIEQIDVINEVITLQEAADMLGCADGTLRRQVLKGVFKQGEYRKAKGTILFYKKVIENLVNEKSKI